MATTKSVAKIEPEEPSLRLAVLIDADNAPAAVIEGLLAEVARYGVASVKRVYGDFTTPASKSWREVLQQFAIKPVQQFAYTKGKNATDSALIIDAMDLLYSQKVDGFCLVTSDSDFTGLAMRLREAGLMVMGFGEEKTPVSFRSACDRFFLTEVLRGPAREAPQPEATTPDPSKPTAAKSAKRALPNKVLLEALAQSVGDDGWAGLGPFGQYLSRLKPDFDARIYGHRKLSDLVRAHAELFEVTERKAAGSGGKVLYLRAKEQT